MVENGHIAVRLIDQAVAVTVHLSSDTTVAAISGSTVTLDKDAMATGTSTLTFTPGESFYYTVPSSAEFIGIVNRFRWRGIDDLWLYTWDKTGSVGDIGLSAYTDSSHIHHSSALAAAVSNLKAGSCTVELDQPKGRGGSRRRRRDARRERDRRHGDEGRVLRRRRRGRGGCELADLG